MKLVLRKYHCMGNDYLVYDTGKNAMELTESRIRRLCHRNFGIGSDGLILICPSRTADCRMEMYNADGSRGAMCGNGIRCVGKYVYDKGLTDKKQISIVSFGNVKYVDLYVENGLVRSVKVNMGAPVLEAKKVPVKSAMERSVDEPITVNGKEYRMTCVSMGNPHAVIFMENIAELDIASIGPLFENHEVFPNRTNTEFVEVVDRTHVNMRVWERGTGETLACGTGACACAVASVLTGKTDRDVTVHLRGGDLHIFWDPDTDDVYMEGPAAFVFDGTVEI